MKKILCMIMVLAMSLTVFAGYGYGEQITDQTTDSASGQERALPESFDLRSVDTDGDGIGDRCYVPPVRNQRPFGSCWGFAAAAAAEISILGSILDYDADAWKNINLSEKQLVYFSHTPLNDPENPQNGEGWKPEGTDAQGIYSTGGVSFLAAAGFAQGIGPSNESSDEILEYHGAEKNTIQHYFDGAYRNYCYSDRDDWTIPEEYRFKRDYYLQESVLLPSPAKNEALGPYDYHPEYNDLIKEQLLEKRGVAIGFYADVSRPDQDLDEVGKFLNNITWAHYTWDENMTANHAVTIIGWDDNYPKENFLEGHQPEGDGAWLVRNSWGSAESEFPDYADGNWGILVQKTDENGDPVFDENGDPVMIHSGYFWLSYYDRTIVTPESFVFTTDVAPEYVDQSDYMHISEVKVNKYDEPVRMANVFTAKHAQLLSDISCMTAELNTEVEYEIYILCNDFETPDEGLLASSGKITFEYGGYHKISLDEGVYLQKDQPYSIVLTMKGEDASYQSNEPVGYKMGELVDQIAVINEKESFLFRDGIWEDYKKVTEAQPDMVATVTESFGTCYDNFSIKGYSSRITGDISMVLDSSSNMFAPVEGYDTTKVMLFFDGPLFMEMGTPEIEWSFLNGSEEYAEFVPQKNASQVLLTAKKEGTVYLAAHLKGMDDYGTGIIKIKMTDTVPDYLYTDSYSNVYTGQPVTPHFTYYSLMGEPLTEGVDYTVSYTDNILCGQGTATFTMIAEDTAEGESAGQSADQGEGESEGQSAGLASEPVTEAFMIIPQKTEIINTETSGNTIRIEASDLWETGISGYEIQYRKVGDETWNKEKITDSAQGLEISGLESGVSYEVRVRAFAVGKYLEENDFAHWYGEFSSAVTVEVK